MIKSGVSVALLTLTILLILAGTPAVTAQSGKFPVGSYEVGPFTISFKEGGNYEVIHSSEGGVQGNYKISGDQIEVTDVSGDFACPESVVGKYTWKVEADKLVLTVIDDQCEGRAEGFSHPLAKKSSK